MRSFGGFFQIGISCHNKRRMAAQFQTGAFQVSGRGAQDRLTCDVIQSLSINQLYNELVKCDIATEAERALQIKCVASEILASVVNNIAFGDGEPTTVAAANTTNSKHSVEEHKANLDTIRRGEIIKMFIEQSQTQISHHGLCGIKTYECLS